MQHCLYCPVSNNINRFSCKTELVIFHMTLKIKRVPRFLQMCVNSILSTCDVQRMLRKGGTPTIPEGLGMEWLSIFVTLTESPAGARGVVWADSCFSAGIRDKSWGVALCVEEGKGVSRGCMGHSRRGGGGELCECIYSSFQGLFSIILPHQKPKFYTRGLHKFGKNLNEFIKPAWSVEGDEQ